MLGKLHRDIIKLIMAVLTYREHPGALIRKLMIKLVFSFCFWSTGYLHIL